MLHSWLRILPLFIVERIARKYSGRINQGGAVLICGPKGTYFHEPTVAPAIPKSNSKE